MNCRRILTVVFGVVIAGARQDAVEPFGGKIVETDLNENDIAALRKALRKNA